MAHYYLKRKVVGHVGDVLSGPITGAAYLIREESDNYFLVENPREPSADWTAIRKNLVALQGDSRPTYWVIACPHSIPPDQPLPEATSE